MKNVFKFLGIALVAGALLTACGEKYTVTVNVNDNTMGTVTGAGDYDPDATCTLTASPNSGYEFVSWSDGTNTITENPYTFTVTADATFTATFAKKEGVNVTFGSATWKADASASQYSFLSQYNDFVLALVETSGSLPQAMIWANSATGDHAGTIDDSSWAYDNEDAYMCDYFADGGVTINYQDGSQVSRGDWWAYTWTATVNSFDATAMTLDASVSATMFDVKEAYGDGGTGSAATASHQNMTVSAAVTLTASKAPIAKVNAGKGIIK